MELDPVRSMVARWRDVRPDLDPSPMLVVDGVRHLAAALDALLAPLLAGAGLGQGEFDVLCALRRAGPPCALTPGALSIATAVTSGAVTKRVDRLDLRGLVTRRVSARDARSRLIALTPDGVTLTDSLIARHLKDQHSLVQGLTTREVEQLSALLARFGETLPPRLAPPP